MCDNGPAIDTENNGGRLIMVHLARCSMWCGLAEGRDSSDFSSGHVVGTEGSKSRTLSVDLTLRRFLYLLPKQNNKV